MQDVAPGRTIGGRYTLNERRLASADGIEAWSARDSARAAEVTLTLFPATAAPSPAILDAARRAAHVQDDRLVRILDVGTSGHLSWIVEEDHGGAATLVDVVEDNPLTGEETRTVVGEAAACLAAAARRGMHHLRLTPYSVLVTRDGEVKVSGLGTVLALEGGVEPPPERAELLDTLGLLALGYYAMTTRWPLPDEVPGILPAPRVGGQVPQPSEIAAGVPGDVDELCRTALNGLGGPRTPADLARELAPWRSTLREPVSSAAASDLLHHRPDAADLPVLSEPPAAPPAAPRPPLAALVPEVVVTPTPTATLPAAADALVVDPPAPDAPVPDASDMDAPDMDDPAVDVTAPDTAHPAVAEAGPESTESNPEASDTDPDAAEQDRPSAKALAAGAAAATAATAGEVVGRLGTFARAAVDKAQEAREEVRARVAAERAEREWAEQHAVRLADIPDEADREAPGPLMRMLDPDERPGTHSRVVLASVAGFVAMALLVAMFVVWRGLNAGGGSPATAAPSTSKASTVASATTPAAPAGPATPVAIIRGTSIDPVGDDGENDSQIPRAFDGSTATKWQSELYRADPGWDGTAKRGVGLAFRLDKPATLRSVTLTLPSSPGQSGALYVGAEPSLTGATKVGEFTDATGSTEVTLSGGDTAQYLIVWFTKAPRDGGGYRATLLEVAPMG